MSVGKRFTCDGYTLEISTDPTPGLSSDGKSVYLMTGEFGVSLPPSAVRELITYLQQMVRREEPTEATYTLEDIET